MLNPILLFDTEIIAFRFAWNISEALTRTVLIDANFLLILQERDKDRTFALR